MEKAKILCSCGTGIATSTVVSNKIANICKKNNINYELVQCKACELPSKIADFKPTIIVSTTPVSSKTDIPVFSGIPFLSGVGMDKLEKQIVEALKK